MSRTPLFAAVKKALAVASHENGVVWPRTSALTRRQLLRLSAAAAGAPALAPVLDRRAYAKKPGPSSIAIVGGGVAGLTAASFAAARREAGSVRSQQPLGGRMFTQYDFYKGMFCELGGEFVGTGHEDLQNLATEVGVEMQT
jgi:monoamine oxidase